MSTAIMPAESDHLSNVRALAKVMDAAIEIPGTRIKIGLDALLGLLPGVGDAIGAVVGSYIVMVAGQLGVPKAVIGRMLLNMGVDALIGLIPFAGDLLDVAWKANTKNVALLERSLADPQAARRSSTWWIVGAGVVVLLLGAAGAALTWFLIQHFATK